MTVLITGATGRVGSRLVPRLLSDGQDVRVLIRDAERGRLLRESGADVILGDLRETEVVRRAVQGVDAVVHLAISPRGISKRDATAIDQVATVGLARSALNAGVKRFVFISTSLVYCPGRGRPYRESDQIGPNGAYAESKTAAERGLQELNLDQGLGLCILRLGFVYGEGDPHLSESLAWARLRPAHKRLHMVHHADLGQAAIRALHADDVGAFNVADDAPITAAELFELNDEPLPGDLDDNPLGDPWEGIVNNSKIRRLGFRPIYPSVYVARDDGAL
jgi:nucleoside-diphosphate-sugar epimerase